MQKSNLVATCKICNKRFYTTPYRQKIGKDKFCSKACVIQGHSIFKNCLVCGHSFKIWLAHSQRVNCCSRECGYKSRRSFAGVNNPSWKGGKPRCIDCGVLLANIYANRCNEHKGFANKGAKNNNWKGGITPENLKIRSSLEYKQWRRAVLKRDNYICQLCGIKNHKGLGYSVKLNVDHIKPFAEYPELRTDTNNGRVLCVTCHRLLPTTGRRKKIYAST